MIQVNALGDTCPIPVVKTKKAIETMEGPGVVETLVDNEIAVQNLTKMANQKGYAVKSEKIEEGQYKVTMVIGKKSETEIETAAEQPEAAEEEVCVPDKRKDQVVVISSSTMGNGNDELGAVLIKGFLYALSQQDTLPGTILFYNGGVKLACEGSASLEDLKSMEAQGVEILACGTCLNFYELTDHLAVGSVTNMYEIVERMTQARQVIKP